MVKRSHSIAPMSENLIQVTIIYARDTPELKVLREQCKMGKKGRFSLDRLYITSDIEALGELAHFSTNAHVVRGLHPMLESQDRPNEASNRSCKEKHGNIGDNAAPDIHRKDQLQLCINIVSN